MDQDLYPIRSEERARRYWRLIEIGIGAVDVLYDGIKPLVGHDHVIKLLADRRMRRRRSMALGVPSGNWSLTKCVHAGSARVQ